MLKNTTRVKIPKKYFEMVATLDLNEETGLYEAVCEKGYIFPTIKAYKGEAKGHKGIWEIIRYVEADGFAKIEAVKEIEEPVIEVPVIPASVNVVWDEVAVAEEESIQPELEIVVEQSITEGKSIKELWVIAKACGFKGATRWSKEKLVAEIKMKEAEALA